MRSPHDRPLSSARTTPDSGLYVPAPRERLCQQIHGEGLDKAISTLLIQQVTPLTLEVTLAVQAEIETRSEEGDRLRGQEVERARYQTDLARRRFMQVDPDNRL